MRWGLVALNLVHVACASIWFGSSWLAGGDVRRTLALGRPYVDALPDRIGRLERLAIPCGVLTLVTGLGLVAYGCGLWAMPVRLRVVLGLTLATMAVGGLLVSPSWRKIVAATEVGDDLSPARVAAVRFERALWLEHFLRVLTLAFVVGRVGGA